MKGRSSIVHGGGKRRRSDILQAVRDAHDAVVVSEIVVITIGTRING